MDAIRPLAFALLVVACGEQPGTDPAPAPGRPQGVVGMEAAVPGPVELHFLDVAIPNFEASARMAELAVERGQRGDVRAWSAAFARRQRARAEELRQLRARWFPDAPPPPSPEVDDDPRLPTTGVPSGEAEPQERAEPLAEPAPVEIDPSLGPEQGVPQSVALEIGVAPLDTGELVRQMRFADAEHFDRVYLDSMLAWVQYMDAVYDVTVAKTAMPDLQRRVRGLEEERQAAAATLWEWKRGWATDDRDAFPPEPA